MDTHEAPSGWRGASVPARVATVLAAALFLLLLGRTVRDLAAAPVGNWDMLGYMGLALEWEESDPSEVHRRTYELAQAELPRRTYAELIGPHPVRKARYENAEAFVEHIAFYRARVLYTLSVWFTWKCGVPLSSATWGVSLACFTLSALLLLLWASRHLPFYLAAILAAGLAHTPALLTTAGYSTADGMSLFLTLLGSFLWVESRSRLPGAAVLSLSILVRPDAVIFVGVLAGLAWLLERKEDRPSLVFSGAWILASGLVYLAVQAFGGAYGYWPLFWISFVQKEIHPATLPTSFDFAIYREVLGRQFATLPGDGYYGTPRLVTGSTLVFVNGAFALLGLALARMHAARPELRRPAAFLAALLVAYGLRYFLFPQVWDRFFAPYHVTIPLLLVGMIVPFLKPGGPRSTPTPSTEIA